MEDVSGWNPRNLCDHCLGRIFARVSTGLTNQQRGQIARAVLSSFSEGGRADGKCILCRDLFDDMERYAEACFQRMNGYQFSTFLVGSTVHSNILENEKVLQERYGDRGESLKKEFDRELGKILSSMTGKEFSNDPDLYIHVDLRYDSISIKARSIYIYGTYRKLVRGIPQTRWIHGSGETVESIIGEPLKVISDSIDYRLHGAGREDVDVRMLGNGREFVIEGVEPKVRNFDLSTLRREINESGKVFVTNLSFTGKDTVERIKKERYSKIYDITAEGSVRIDSEKIRSILSAMDKKVIYQRTPLRVSRTRSDLVRERMVSSPEILWVRGQRFGFRITAEAGLYLKEFVSGDNGRTEPSVSSLYGDRFHVIRMDVTRILR